MKYQILDTILDSYEAREIAEDYGFSSEEEGAEMYFNEIYYEGEWHVGMLPKYKKFISTIEGGDLYYDYSADYYFLAKTEDINENINMKKNLIRLTEGDLHRIIKESVKNILKESDNPYNKGQYSNGGNGVISDMLGVTYEEVRNVYNALYGYQNYDGSNNEEFEQGINEWWNTILSNARRQNLNSNQDTLSRSVNRRHKSFRR